MIFQLTANIPMRILSVRGVVSIYVRQYGAGNLRLGMNKEDLINTAPVNAPPGQIVDGIPQAAADGKQQYFWSGDLWVISDVAGPVMVLAPAWTLYLDSTQGRGQPSDVEIPLNGGELSTY